MRIVKSFILTSAIQSGIFSLLLIALASFFALHDFSIREETQLKAEFTNARNQIIRYYTYGDLITLRTQLNGIASEAQWADASFVDSEGQPVWKYYRTQPVTGQLDKSLWEWKLTRRSFNVEANSSMPIISMQAEITNGPTFLIGHLTVSKNIWGAVAANINQLRLIFILFAILWLGHVALTALIAKRNFRPLLLLEQQLHVEARNVSLTLSPAMDSEDELQRIRRWFAEIVHGWQAANERVVIAERNAAVANLAQQVAHDVRSPLAALEVIVKSADDFPEEKRIMIRSAVGRIRDIANHLLSNSGFNKTELSNRVVSVDRINEGSTSVQLISSLIDPLVTEKRMQFRSRIGIEIDASIDQSSYGLFAEIAPTEFKRVISNLINNAVEALGERGTVSISLSGSDGDIAITVKDNGKGIPPEIVAKLGHRGETHGKAQGSGLGLYHARSSVELWGGRLEIHSEIGKGTSVLVILPRARPPDWFVSELKIESSSTVVIADDDASIHQIWDGRFESIRAHEKGIELLHFSTPEEVIKWANDSKSHGRKVTYLIDHEFIGDKRTGLDVVESLNLGGKAILVTSRFEEKAILDGCRKLGVRLIPKGMAGFVPISIAAKAAEKDSPDLVLIDDDDSIHITWRFSAKRNGKKIRAYSKPDDFFAEEKDFSRSLPIYVDANLGDDIHGDEVAKQIFDLGFTDVYLATGYQAKEFSHLTFLKGVQGKDPPW